MGNKNSGEKRISIDKGNLTTAGGVQKLSEEVLTQSVITTHATTP